MNKPLGFVSKCLALSKALIRLLIHPCILRINLNSSVEEPKKQYPEKRDRKSFSIRGVI